MDRLQEYRTQIDQLDAALAALFEQRLEVTRMVGEYKREYALPIEHTAREEEILVRRAAAVRDAQNIPFVEQFMRAMFAISKQQQCVETQARP